MSEVRQRRGGEAAAGEQKDVAKTQEEKEVEAKEFIDKIHAHLDENRPVAAKGLSNAAKQWKIALEKDEKNMDLIFQLGTQYCIDAQWDRAVNVLMRGWKRVDELEDEMVRNEFLVALTQASEKVGKFKQALAVMSDIQDVEDEEVQQKVGAMKCRVYCQNGDTTKALRALSQATNGCEFERAAAAWASLIVPLTKCGAYHASKSSMLAMASTEKEKESLEAMERFVAYKDMYYASSEPQPFSNTRKVALAGIIFTGLMVLVMVFSRLEAASLKALAPAK